MTLKKIMMYYSLIERIKCKKIIIIHYLLMNINMITNNIKSIYNKLIEE